MFAVNRPSSTVAPPIKLLTQPLPMVRRFPPAMIRKPLWILGSLLAFGASAQNAFADAGTPLMWATMLHLVVGNAIIGVGEGLVLAKLFSLKKLKTVVVLIAANYFSAWGGGWFLESAIVRYLHMDLNNAWTWFWVLVAATYLMTLVIEWPFVAFCLRGKDGWLRKSLMGNLVIQTLSYVLLFGWYWMASGSSLYTKMQIVPAGELSLPESVLVYFISEKDGNVYAGNFSNIKSHQIFELNSTNENDRLFVKSSSTRTNYWDLMARIEIDNNRDPKLVEIKNGLAKEAVSDWRADQNPPKYEGTWFSFGNVPRLGSAGKSDWEFETGFWPIEGLRGTSNLKNLHVHFSFETPFGAWNVRNATQLSGDDVLFQLGQNQICIFNPNTKRVSLLTYGRGPVAIIPEITNEPISKPDLPKK